MNNCDWEETQNAAISKLEADLDDPDVTWKLLRDYPRAKNWRDAPLCVLNSSTDFFISEVVSPTEGDKPFLRAMLRSAVLNYEHNERVAEAYKKGVNKVRCAHLAAQLAYKPPTAEEIEEAEELKRKAEEATKEPLQSTGRSWWSFWQ